MWVLHRERYAISLNVVASVTVFTALLFVFILPWRQALPAIPNLLSIGAIAGMGLAASWACLATLRGAVRDPHRFHVALGAIVAWAALSALWTIDIGRTLFSLRGYAMVFIMTYVIWDLARTRLVLRVFLQTFVFGALVAIVLVLAEFVLFGITDRHAMLVGFNAPTISRTLVFAVPVAIYLALTNGDLPRNNSLTVVNTVYPVLVGVTVLIIAARQAIVVLGAAAVVYGAVAVQQEDENLPSVTPRRAAGSAILLVCAGTAAVLVAPSAAIERVLETPDVIVNQGLNNRLTIWMAGLSAFSGAGPLVWLVGVGSGAFTTAVEPILTDSVRAGAYYWPHNAFLGPLVELGVVGLGLLLVTVGTAARSGLQSRECTPMIASIVASWLLFALVADVHLDTVPWLLFTVAAIAPTVSQTR